MSGCTNSVLNCKCNGSKLIFETKDLATIKSSFGRKLAFSIDCRLPEKVWLQEK